MAERVTVSFKHAVCGEEAQDAAQRTAVGADRGSKVSRRPRRLVQYVGDAEVGHYVQTAR